MLSPVVRNVYFMGVVMIGIVLSIHTSFMEHITEHIMENNQSIERVIIVNPYTQHIPPGIYQEGMIFLGMDIEYRTTENSKYFKCNDCQFNTGKKWKGLFMDVPCSIVPCTWYYIPFIKEK